MLSETSPTKATIGAIPELSASSFTTEVSAAGTSAAHCTVMASGLLAVGGEFIKSTALIGMVKGPVKGEPSQIPSISKPRIRSTSKGTVDTAPTPLIDPDNATSDSNAGEFKMEQFVVTVSDKSSVAKISLGLGGKGSVPKSHTIAPLSPILGSKVGTPLGVKAEDVVLFILKFEGFTEAGIGIVNTTLFKGSVPVFFIWMLKSAFSLGAKDELVSLGVSPFILVLDNTTSGSGTKASIENVTLKIA